MAQDYRPLEVIISDDCSTDRSHEIALEAAQTASPDIVVRVIRNEKNIGLIGHLQSVARLSTGEVIVVAAGDDISLPNRVTKTAAVFAEDPSVKTVSMDLQPISRNGATLVGRKRAFRDCVYTWKQYARGAAVPLLGASRAYRKDLITAAPLSSQLRSEDNVLVARALLLTGKMRHIPEVGVMYRVSENSMSSRLNSGAFVAAYRQKTRDARRFRATGVISNVAAKRAIAVYAKQLQGKLVFSRVYDGPRVQALQSALCNRCLSAQDRYVILRRVIGSFVSSRLARSHQ